MAFEHGNIHYTESGYVDSGPGETVVLLDWTPWELGALRDGLASRYRVLGFDPPALAKSAEEAANAVSYASEAAGLASFALVGTSLGADAALRLALMRPNLVSPLVLVSPTCVQPAASTAADTPELAAAMLAHPEAAGATPADPDRTEALSALANQWRRTEGDATRRLPELACATLVVLGQEDRLVSREAGGIWKAQVPNCSICYVYDAGHAIAVDRPDALVKVVLDFVERRETFVVENRSSLINP